MIGDGQSIRGRDEQPKLWGVVVTFHRLSQLKDMLAHLDHQTQRIYRLLIVDNGSDLGVRQLARDCDAVYLDCHQNLGPAGGIAKGLEYVLERAHPEDWIVLLDDDDPPTSPVLLETLTAFAMSMRQIDERLGGVGLVGARYSRRYGVVQRLLDSELNGAVAVDYIGGGQFPIYSCRVLSAVGPSNESLFFGFDDLELGLRIRRAGYSLYVEGEMLLAERVRHNRTGRARRASGSNSNTAAWRRYYSVRNGTLIAKTNAGVMPARGLALLGALRGTVELLRYRRPIHEILFPLRGAIDGLLGRTGRTIDPGMAQKQHRTP